MSRSASLMACSVWMRMSASMPIGFSTSPPVSMHTYCTGPSLPYPYWRSRVTPGTSATMASRVFVSVLNSVDLPTFGRPTIAMTGSMELLELGKPSASSAARSRRCGRRGFTLRRARTGRRSVQGHDVAPVIDQVEIACRGQRRIGDAIAARLGAACRQSRGAIEPVHVSLEIGDDHVVANDRRSRQTAALEGFIAPHFDATAALECHHVALRSADVHLLVVDIDSAIAGYVMRPPDLARIERQHGSAALEAGHEHVIAHDLHCGVDVIETLELGAAMRGRDGRVPHGSAVGDTHGEHAAVVEAGNCDFTRHHRRRRSAQGESRNLLFRGPELCAVGQ